MCNTSDVTRGGETCRRVREKSYIITKNTNYNSVSQEYTIQHNMIPTVSFKLLDYPIV